MWTDVVATRTQIMGAIGLPLSAPRWVEWTQRALDRIETYNGQPGIDLIEDYVSKYTAAESAANTASSDAGIKILGIGTGIEYFEGGAVSGYKSEMTRYKNLIIQALFIQEERSEIRQFLLSSPTGRVKITR
jgi:hypothetical protein